MRKITVGWMSVDIVKLLLNVVKVQMAIDSGASANIMDEERFQKIQERFKEKLQLEKSKLKLPYPLLENSTEWLRLTRKRLQLLLKGKTKDEMLLGCGTALELGVLKPDCKQY